MKIKVGAQKADRNYLATFMLILEHAGVEVEEIWFEKGAILVNDKVVGFLAYADYDKVPPHQETFILENDVKVVFKFNYHKNSDYSHLGVPVIPLGYISPLVSHRNPYGEFVPFEQRTIDLTARMGVNGPDQKQPRWKLINQAVALKDRYNVAAGKKIDPDLYLEELPKVKIGVNWTRRSYPGITHKIIEYFRFGLCTISDDTECLFLDGTENGAELIDGENVVIFKNPEDMTGIFEELIKDPQKIERIGHNAHQFYHENLSPKKMGEFVVAQLEKYL